MLEWDPGSGFKHTKTLVTLNPLELDRFLDGPFANVRPLLVTGLVNLLLGVRDLPSAVPIVCELFVEGSLDGKRLW